MSLRRYSPQPGCIGRSVLLWFLLSLGVAIAAPLVHPQAVEMVCSGAGAIKLLVPTDAGLRELGAAQLDCPLCLLSDAPPPRPVAALSLPLPWMRAVALRVVAPAVRVAAAPMPARGPPRWS